MGDDFISSSVSEKFSFRSTEVTDAVSRSGILAAAEKDLVTGDFTSIGGLGALRWGSRLGLQLGWQLGSRPAEPRGAVEGLVIVPEVEAGEIWDGGVA